MLLAERPCLRLQVLLLLLDTVPPMQASPSPTHPALALPPHPFFLVAHLEQLEVVIAAPGGRHPWTRQALLLQGFGVDPAGPLLPHIVAGPLSWMRKGQLCSLFPQLGETVPGRRGQVVRRLGGTLVAVPF